MHDRLNNEPLGKTDGLMMQALAQAAEAHCLKCGQVVDKMRAILKVKTSTDPADCKYVCNGCNSVSVMVARHMDWPPAMFSELSDEEQMAFWKNCRETADPAGRFKYGKVRATLSKILSHRKITTHSAEEWSDPKPLEYWRQNGWDAVRIEQKGRKVWNEVAGDLYEVPVIRRSSKVEIQEVEEHIKNAEQKIRMNRKRELEQDDDESSFLESSSEDEAPTGKSKELTDRQKAKKARQQKKKEADQAFAFQVTLSLQDQFSAMYLPLYTSAHFLFSHSWLWHYI